MATTCINNTTSVLTVEQLVRAAKSGDRTAFGELARRFEGTVYATALRQIRDPLEAEELVQEVFLCALQKLDQLRTLAAFGGWLRAIARRLAINRAVRRPPTVATPPEVFEATCAAGAAPLDDILTSERNEQVQAALSRLQELDRDTLVAFYFQGQSLVEMSDRFASPVGTIKRRLHVARKRLAEQLEMLAPCFLTG